MTIADPRDNELYRIVKIGSLLWFRDNLRFKHPESFCYEKDERLHDKYGRLYPFYGVDDAIPDGWRLPTMDDSAELQIVLGHKDNLNGLFEKLVEGGNSGLDLIMGGYFYRDFQVFNMHGYYRIFDYPNHALHIGKFNNVTSAGVSSSNFSQHYFSIRCVRKA